MHPILADRRRLQVYLVAWGLVGALLSVLVRAVIGVAWPEAMAFGLPLGMVAAPMSLSSWYVCRAMPLSRTPVSRVALTSAGAAGLTAVVWAVIGQAWWVGLGRLGFDMHATPVRAVITLVMSVGALAYLGSVSVQYVLATFEESADVGRRMLRSEIAQREAELTALRAQTDPHFLFNSLNSISGLIAGHPEQAREMCQRLADFLRDSLALGSSERIPLAREVALAEQYLRIEQVRFGRRLAVETSVAPDSATIMVPPLILQPLVENAVRHGIATSLEGGRIDIATRRMGPRVVVTILNPRDADGDRRGLGFGVGLVRRRLTASFGDAASLVLEPAESSYRVTMTLPVEGARENGTHD